MNCKGCGNEDAWHVKSAFDHVTKQWSYACDKCGLQGGGESVPDTYFTGIGQKFQNLCDKMGVPIPIQSRQHKKQVMAVLGVREAGDLVNGAPYGGKNWIEGTREHRRKQFEKDRPMIRQTYARYLENVRRKS